jgi:hypothetical protein
VLLWPVLAPSSLNSVSPRKALLPDFVLEVNPSAGGWARARLGEGHPGSFRWESAETAGHGTGPVMSRWRVVHGASRFELIGGPESERLCRPAFLS